MQGPMLFSIYCGGIDNKLGLKSGWSFHIHADDSYLIFTDTYLDNLKTKKAVMSQKYVRYLKELVMKVNETKS